MIKNHKWQLLISSIIILLPSFIGLVLRNDLPIPFLFMPVIILAIYWLCIFITAKDPQNENQNQKILRLILWIIPMITLVASSITFAVISGVRIHMNFIAQILFGVMFLLIGNYLPKCKQNHTIGIKILWTLRSEENWNRTHRLAGKIWVIGGFLILISMLIPFENVMYGILAIILIIVLIPFLYSFFYYKKQLREGTTEKAVSTPEEKKTSFIALIIILVIFIFVGIFMFTGDIQVTYDDTSFSVKVSYWEDATINYEDITEIEYRQQDDPGDRIMGLGSGRLLAGEFQNDEFGSYSRYSYVKCDSCIVLTVNEKTIILNGENEQATKDIYEELILRIQK